MKTVDLITFILIIIGALIWGAVGAFDFNPVAIAFGPAHAATRGIYILVGLSAVYHAIAFRAIQQRWRPRTSRTL